MKSRLTLLAIALFSVMSMSAADLTGKRIYVNPGHGSFGFNDRPMATIPFPALASTGMPDTCGFYESNTNLWKCLYLGERLEKAGATVVYSRTKNGPWPYEKVNGEYPDFSWDEYKNLPNYEQYNRALSDICEEVEAGNFDLFISVHSNAATEGTTTNYPIWLYRGTDATPSDFEKTSKEIGGVIWPYRFEMMDAGYDPASYYSLSNPNLRGDVSFMGSGSTSTRSNGKQYYGYYGVLKHGTVGGLYEGYFHTYQPGRHRALNQDHCHMEGYAYYRGIIDYFGADKDTKGYILGTVKDLHEKIVNNLFKYNPKTNDQWLPCNGATVKLLKNGKEIASYQVDTFYNGVFYFGDLEPGEYTLDASCEGYKPLFNEYKLPVKVEANKVTYPFIFLEAENYEAPKEVYYDYPEPQLPAYLGIGSRYEMAQEFTGKTINETLAEKKVHRMLLKNDSTLFVLAFDNDNNGYIYQVNPQTQTLVRQLSTEGMQGEIRPLGDIALTADGVLLACNYTETQFNDTYVNEDSKTGKRGTFRVYKWEDLTTAPVEMFNSQYSANWYGGNIGESMTVSGALNELTMVVTCPTRSGSGVLRLVNFQTSDGQLVSTLRNQDPNNATLPLTLPNYGWNMQIKPSPLHTGSFLLIGDKTGVTEIAFNGDGAAPTYQGTTPFVADGATFFRYAKHVLMAVPKVLESKNIGVELYDVTNGLSQAQLIKTTNTALDAAEYNYQLAAGLVTGQDINLYLALDNALSKITTAGQTQAVPAHINAWALDMTYNETETEYTFSYTANADANTTHIVFYQMGEEVGRVAVDAAKKGKNEATIKQADLPLRYSATPATWAVEMSADNVPTWGELVSRTSESMGMIRMFNTIDLSPESKNFQRIYLNNYGQTIRMTDKQGVYVMDQEYNLLNTEPQLGGQSVFGCMYRPSVDAEGTVYFCDWTDANSGIYVADKGDVSTLTQFFQGTRNTSTGVFTNNGIETGSSTPASFVYGKGKDTKLIVYNEDKGSSLVENGLCIYNIGQEDGTILHTWDKAPSQVLSIAGQLNSEGNVWAIDKGIFVSQNRGSGNNNYSATSLQFFDWTGKRLMCSADDQYSEIILGSEGSAFALSKDEKTLVLNGVDKSFYVFDIEWQEQTPVLTLRYEYKHGYGSSSTNAFRQLNFDYAGNLIATGDPGLVVFTLPTDNNLTCVPANSSLTVETPFSGTVEGVLLSEKEVALTKGQTFTLTATVLPEAATDKSVQWTSSNEAVATVSDGVLTALKSGETTITVKTTVGELTATCKVVVTTPVTGVSLDKTEAEGNIGETITLQATVMPEDADNKAVLWSSSNEAVATVANGVVSLIGEGEATITVTTVDGAFTATCTIKSIDPTVYVTGVSLNLTEATLRVEETLQLTATVTPEDATDKSVTWETADETIATVSDEGLVTAVAVGQTTITVKTVDGEYTATLTLTVIAVDDAVEQIEGKNTQARKYIENGTIFIEKDGETYSVGGQKVK